MGLLPIGAQWLNNRSDYLLDLVKIIYTKLI